MEKEAARVEQYQRELTILWGVLMQCESEVHLEQN